MTGDDVEHGRRHLGVGHKTIIDRVGAPIQLLRCRVTRRLQSMRPGVVNFVRLGRVGD
jgi:hypothetical protein